MSRKYKFRNPNGLYFVTFTVIKWIDAFTRTEYIDVMLDSWKFCQKNKKLRIHAWCIMSNHVHMIISSDNDLPSLMRDMKSFTSRKLRNAIIKNPKESRKSWMLKIMNQTGIKNGNNNDFQLWQQNNHPIELVGNHMINQKLNYIHKNPVKAGFAPNVLSYNYSSAPNYAGENGLIEVDLLD